MALNEASKEFALTSVSPEFNVMMHAISNCAGPVVQQIIQQQPHLVNSKGWHGNTALHRACLVGDINVVTMLVNAGADPNTSNDSGETPLHYAAKRGIPSVFYFLTKNGGQVNAVDNYGRRMAHHASETGSVFMLHYLSSVHNVSFRDVDKKLQSPLHIICGFGHAECFKYLIKKERSDLIQGDYQGNTPMHLTVMEGHGHMTWLLLKEVGCSVLHQRNKEGYTPVDIACQRDRPGHKEITPVLKSYESVRDHSYKPAGPWLLWYWHLLCPAIIYTACILCSKLFSEYQGAVFMVGMFVTVYLMKTMTHRIKHVCRWPNPIYTGAFGAGLIHSVILYFYLILPYLYYNVWLVIFTAVFASVLLMLFTMVLYVDPGTVKESVINPATGQPKTLFDLVTSVPPGKFGDYCIDCEIACPRWTKHCRLCNRCFRQMDHHCLFLLKCIAEKNHVYFIWFIITCIISMITFVASAVTYCQQFYNRSFWDTVIILFHTDGWLLSLTFFNSVSIFWGLQLLFFQISIISKGYTTYFQPTENMDILTTSEKLMNVLYFLLKHKAYIENEMLKQDTLSV